MSHINQFVNVCTHNNVREVKRLIGEGLDVNARNTQGWPGLHLAMYKYNGSTVRLLLASSIISLESTDSNNRWTALHCACDRNNVEGVKLFLAHPACTKQIVRMKSVDGDTAEMLAKKRGNPVCIRIIKEFLDKPNVVQPGDVGLEDVEPARLEKLTLTQIADAIERIRAVEATKEEVKKSLEVKQKQEIEKLEEEYRLKLNDTLDRHEEENVKSCKDWLNMENKKQILESELQQRANRFNPSFQFAQPDHPSNPSARLIPECPVCMDKMQPPLQIFNCSNGHLICSTCRPSVKICYCKAKYLGRATAMEQMVRQILGMM